MPTKLIIIRHAQTEWNLLKRYCGSADLGLNARGKKQAIKLRKALKNIPVDEIYSSNKKRAIQTAEIVFKKRPIKIIPGLKEIHFGIFEGFTYDEIMGKHPLIYKKWLKNPYLVNIPKGESMKNFKKRALGAFKKIIHLNKDKTVAVVCHGGTISVFLNYILKSKDFWKYIPKSASLSIVECAGRKSKIKLFSDTRHLQWVK